MRRYVIRWHNCTKTAYNNFLQSVTANEIYRYDRALQVVCGEDILEYFKLTTLLIGLLYAQ